MKIFSIVSFILILIASLFEHVDAQALSPWGKIGLAALGGAVVDRTFSRQPTNNYYYSYPGYYTYGKKK
ncbi:hypothetical protein GCK72_002566 [Caenorhabditis remanei]|uniref:Uncharacterized protein n=1 Tax=Caenorhabditis remanei TaxID=31234 RepID=A0A6A5HWK0_CAERE|nr:hypothetical protein GCK72_002566 [Caenorhabditis remanei]KAF1770743.1 hypothetical protein GCK72_002566 [Caenorhabditis remanei]